MKLSKAIEILEIETHSYPQKGTDNGVEAIKLGIEALKVVQSNRVYGYPNKIPKLPGETPE